MIFFNGIGVDILHLFYNEYPER